MRRFKSGATLRFAKGEYHFRSPTKLYYYISNHDNPQPHSVFLPILNVKDMTMRGDGAVFVFHGSGIGMTLMDTQRVTVKGIAFEWARPPFSEARVVAFDGKGVVLKPDPVRFPLSVEKGRLIAVGEGWKNHVPIIQAFAGDTLLPLIGIHGMGRAEALADGTIRLEMRKPRHPMPRPLRVGDIALMRSGYRPNPGLSLCRAHDTLIEDCTWHGGDGMGLVAQRCENVTVRNNVFRNCAYLHGEGIIQIRPNLRDIKSQKERYHRNIVIERNRFETPRIPLLRACSVSNLVWRDNEVIYNDSFPARGKGPFVIDYSEDVYTQPVVK